MVRYRKARSNEIRKIAKITANSFGEYPIFDLVVAGVFQTKQEYMEFMELMYEVHIKANMKKHCCFVGMEEGKIVSVAVVEQPNVGKINLWDYIFAGGIRLLFKLGFSKLTELIGVMEEANKACHSVHKGSWHIEMIAVDADFKGQQLGSKMIHDCIIPFVRSKEGEELTLITNTERNRKFYIKNGFQEFCNTRIERSGRAIGNWCFKMALELTKSSAYSIMK